MLTDGIGAAARAAGRTLDDAIGPVLTPVAMTRALQPDEVAGLAVYLASPESRGMTGQSIAIDGGAAASSPGSASHCLDAAIAAE
jgi:NAD(P)-dependent dehydrogenase (short-subunit alcohol dehydrogenase family)